MFSSRLQLFGQGSGDTRMLCSKLHKTPAKMNKDLTETFLLIRVLRKK